jgi:hypothetical protein
VPLPAVAVMCGVSWLTLYRVLWTGRVSADMAEVLTSLVRAYVIGPTPRQSVPHLVHAPGVEEEAMARWRVAVR